MLRRSPIIPFVVGLSAIYLAERALTDAARWVTLAIGGVLVGAGVALAVMRLVRARQSKASEGMQAAWVAARAYASCLLALALYVTQNALLGGVEHATLRTALLVAWPTLLLLGLASAVSVELALTSMAHAPVLELWRVRLASRAARVVVYAVIAFAGINYAASRWNRTVDLSYFRVTKPSAATLRLVQELTTPVRLILFAPPGNEVADQVRSYLTPLAAKSPQIKLEVVDQALAQDLARELKVRQNGVLVVARDTQSESLQIGLELDAARTALRKLDGEVQTRLLKVTRPPRVIYMTSGHMERDYQPTANDKRLGFADFRTLAQSIGFSFKRLGLAEGLGSDLPKDAGLVMIAGPTEPFLPAERAALASYLERGGRVLVLIDPDSGDTQDELVQLLGLRVSKALVASELATVRVTGKGASPYYFATTSVASHPSVKTLSQNTARMALVVLGAGAVERQGNPGEMRATFTVHAVDKSWRDENGNGVFDAASEKRGQNELVAVVERAAKAPVPAVPESSADADEALSTSPPLATAAATTPAMRALVIGDADVFGDGVIRNAGNAYLALDGLKWLVGDEELAGETSSEEDIPIVHKRSDDAMWFYGVSFAAPALVLALGLVISRKSKGRRA